ncbi:MAG: type II toxin-antitoxin system prevent-host-death family antitoxin [Deltaproteobacteria bacterium]|nr:type II toxin-antitoxin system prevent-host-death family antitoxin [Deltaproteobacteria bacterium]
MSEYLSKVKRGGEIIVTDRGHPIAKLVPFTVASSTSAERQRLIREGLIEPGRTGRVPRNFLQQPKIKDPEGLILKALLEERREGR